MTNVNQVRRNLASHSYCSICGGDKEDVNHIFREFLEIIPIWQWFKSTDHGLQGESLDYRNWILLNLQDNVVDPQWPTKFCIVLWWAQKWRNSVCFDNSAHIPDNKVVFLHKQFDIVLAALDLGVVLHPSLNRHQQEILITWSPPPNDWILLNTDGAAKDNPGLARVGGVFRDSWGNWIGGFAEKLVYCSSFKAELKAIWRGLRIAREKGIPKL